MVFLILSIPKPRPTANEEKIHLHAVSGKKVPAGSIHEPASLDLTLVIPAYNETKRIGKMLTETIAYLDSLKNPSYEIIVVDDGSKDSTVRTLTLLAVLTFYKYLDCFYCRFRSRKEIE